MYVYVGDAAAAHVVPMECNINSTVEQYIHGLPVLHTRAITRRYLLRRGSGPVIVTDEDNELSTELDGRPVTVSVSSRKLTLLATRGGGGRIAKE